MLFKFVGGMKMARSRRLLVTLTGLILSICLVVETGVTAQAGSNNLESLNGGVAAIIDPSAKSYMELIDATKKETQTNKTDEAEKSKLVMAKVKNTLNVRSEPSEESDIVGKLYKDCGGTILERRDGWTKIHSGNLVGWAKDEYLIFDEEAKELANDVGKMLAYIGTDALRIRTEPSTEAGVYGVLPKGEVSEVVNILDNGWVTIDYEGEDGYVSAEFVTLDFLIDSGETIDEIKFREEAEREAKRNVNFGEYTTDADTTMLLAALIQCEAGGEGYDGQLAVGAVVMNRVRSKAYPDSIHGVIYASGQFTPALSGKVNRVYESGKISATCVQAAEAALAGDSNVGDLTHFRRNNGRDGLVLGNHVFY